MGEVERAIDDATKQVVERLSPLGPIVTRPLHGTLGLYLEDRIFGVIHEGDTYFRTSDATAHKYERHGSLPLALDGPCGTPSQMCYHQVPGAVMADRDLACAWAYEAAATPT